MASGFTMARALSLSNGELFVGLSENGLVDTLHFPFVGSENHTPGLTHRIGVWVDGRLSWIDEDGWSHKFKYPANSLIGHSVMVNESIGIILEFEDFVDADSNVLVRNIHIININQQQRSVRLFCHQAFTIGGYESDNTAQYLPAKSAILHYRGRRAFMVGGTTDVGQDFDQYTVGRFGGGLDGTWRDAEDGELSMSSAECGQTDSTIGFSVIIGGLSSRRVHYWLAASTSVRAVISLESGVRKQGVYRRLSSTTDWWRKWLSPSHKAADQLKPKYRKPFVDSLMTVRANIDRRGAIIYDTSRDDLSICDPLAGSLSIWPMIRLGFRQEPADYFNFIRQSLTDAGHLMMGYRADGSITLTSLAYSEDLPPLDSAQTATSLFVFSQMHALNKQPKFLKDNYASLVVPMADFLVDFIDERGLPRASHDARSDTWGVSTLTTALTYAALTSAAELADSNKDQDSSIKWRTAAQEMRDVAEESFVRNGKVRSCDEGSSVSIGSVYGVFMFGLLDMDHPAIASSVEALEQDLRRDDGLFSGRQGEVDYVGSLWMAQYYMETGQKDKSSQIIDQVAHAISTHGKNGPHLNTWVHAEFVSTLLDSITKK